MDKQNPNNSNSRYLFLDFGSKTNWLFVTLVVSVAFFSYSFISKVSAQVLIEQSQQRNINLNASYSKSLEEIQSQIKDLNSQILFEHLNNPHSRNFTTLVTSRYRKIEKVLNQKPQLVADLLLPKKFASQIKAKAGSNVETYKKVYGKLIIVNTENFSDGTAGVRRFIRYQNQDIEVITPDSDSPLNNITPGSIIEVTGAEFMVDSNPVLLISDLQPDPIIVEQAPVASNVGQYDVGVFFVNWQSDTSQPFTASQMEDVLFNSADSVRAYYDQASLGQVYIDGTVDSQWYTLPNIDCNQSNYLSSLLSNLVSQIDNFTDFSQFESIMIISPKVTTNGCAGVGGSSYQGHLVTNPDSSSMLGLSWMNGVTNMLSVGHEVGHTFGMYHASFWHCTESVAYPPCTDWEYGDWSSIMGASNTGLVNGLHKTTAGWLDSADYVEVTSSGDYSINYANLTTAGIKYLKVPKTRSQGISDPYDWYYIEARQPNGFDTVIDKYAQNSDGVFVYYPHPDIPLRTRLLDMSPGSNNFDVVLRPGQTYTDPIYNVVISVLRQTSDGFDLHVDLLPPPVCSFTAPTVSLETINETLLPGQGVAHTVHITNNDSSVCASSTYDIRIDGLPSSWATSVPTDPVTVAPGKTVLTDYFIQVGSDASAGTYPYTVSAINQADIDVVGSESSSVTIDDSPAPPAINVLEPINNATLSGLVTITAEVTDNDGLSYVSALIDDPNSSLEIEPVLEPGPLPDQYSVQWDSSEVPNGDYHLNIIACDTVGDCSFSWLTQPLYIAVDNPTCTINVPEMNLIPTYQHNQAGSDFSFQGTIINNDTAGCQPSLFDVSYQASTNWGYSITPNVSTVLSPQNSYKFILKISSPTKASEGSHTLEVFASSPNHQTIEDTIYMYIDPVPDDLPNIELR